MIQDFCIIDYYQEFRTALFISGFTLGAFLFSMKSVIMKTMKEDYYDREEYQDNIKQRRSIGQKIGYYSQLKNFSKLLISAICISFLSALSQITLGYIELKPVIYFCLSLAVVSWLLVGVAIYFVSVNWAKALDMAEEIAINKMEGTDKTLNK